MFLDNGENSLSHLFDVIRFGKMNAVAWLTGVATVFWNIDIHLAVKNF